MSKPKESTVEELVETIRPILAGHEPAVQGAVLGYLVGVWVAGHRPDDEVEKDEVWARLLKVHGDLVMAWARWLDKHGDWESDDGKSPRQNSGARRRRAR
jgi:hypothetical protein